MALIPFPNGVHVVGFDYRTDDAGSTIVESAYAATDFAVGSGFSRLAGTIHLKAADFREEGLLQAFHRQLQGDANSCFLPFDREWNGGVFPFGTTFQSGAAVDAMAGELEASTVTLNYTLPSGMDASDVDLQVGSHLTLGTQTVGTVLSVTTAATASRAVVVMIPRVTAGAVSVREAVVKARLRGSQVRLYRGQSGIMYTTGYPWREVA